MKISMNIKYVLFGFFSLGALSLSAMESGQGYDTVRDQILNTTFNPQIVSWLDDQSIHAAKQILGLSQDQNPTPLELDIAYKNRLAVVGLDQACVVKLKAAYDYLDPWVVGVCVANAIFAEFSSNAKKFLDWLPNENDVKRFLAASDQEKVEHLGSFFSQSEIESRCKSLASADANYFKSSFRHSCLREPKEWFLVIFNEKVSQAFISRIRSLYDDIKPGDKRSDEIRKLKNATEWIFTPWWGTKKAKKAYYGEIFGEEVPGEKTLSKRVFSRFYDFAWKKPVVTCGIVGATILGGYYAVKNNLFNNWLGRVRSSFGRVLGSILLRR